MSAIVGKENISYRKKRVTETTDGPSLPQRIQFAHKFQGGEASFSLLNMTLPSAEMPGFANPNAQILTGVGISANPAALRLYISITGGRLVPNDSYRVYGTTIVFLGALAGGMPAGTYVFGEVDLIAANPIIIGDGRFVRKTYSLAVGQTTLNLGITYKVGTGVSSGDQIGDIKVYRNGQLQLRNVANATASTNADGNYQEVDSGNGYGATIVFNSPPTGQADSILVEAGYQVSPGSTQVFSELERLQGAIQALAADAAQAFGNPVGNYLAANATEMDRRSFGNSVLAASTLSQALDAEWTYQQKTGTDYVPSASSIWYPMTNNWVDLGVGTWCVMLSLWFGNNGGNPSYTNAAYNIGGANGTSTTTRPAQPGTLSNVTQLSLNNDYNGGVVPTSSDVSVPPIFTFLKVNSGTARIYGNAYAAVATPASALIRPFLFAQRIKRI